MRSSEPCFAKATQGMLRSFEPYPQLVAPIVAFFDDPTLPWMAMIGHLIRSAA